METAKDFKSLLHERWFRITLFLVVSLIVLVVLGLVYLAMRGATQVVDSAYIDQSSQSNQTKADEYLILPSQTCPESFTQAGNGNIAVIYQGKEMGIGGDDLIWVEQNCNLKADGSSSSQQKGLAGYSSIYCEGSGPVSYTSALLQPSDISQIVPMGRMFDSHVTPTDHQYWNTADFNAGYTDYNVYAPADGVITGLGLFGTGTVSTVDQAVSRTGDDYRMVIEHTCDFSTILIHLHDLTPEILSQVQFDSAGRPTQTPNIKVKAGDLIGKVGGGSFDVTTVDLTKKLTGFANPETYAVGEPWKVYSAATISYFAEPLRTQYYAKVSRSAEPLDGRIDYDKEGYLIGNWYRQGTNGFSGASQERYWDGHFAIALDQHYPSKFLISTGHFLDGKSAQFLASPNSPDPTTVNASTGLVIYNLYGYTWNHANGTAWNRQSVAKDLKIVPDGGIKAKILLQVMEDGTLKQEIVEGSSTQTSFSANAQIYER